VKDGLWVTIDGQDTFVHYSDLEEELMPQVLRPIGGFVYQADAFRHMNLPRVPFYIEDWLPKQGKMLLYGEAKSGKSYLSMQIARCLGQGEPFMGLITQPCRSLYTQFELGEAVLMDRINQTNKDYENVYVGTRLGMKLDTQSGQSDLRRAIEAVEPNVLILDPLYKAIRGDENEASDVMAVLDFLDQMIEGYECSIILVHHAGKDLTKRGRGSSVLEDWVDSYVQIRKIKSQSHELIIKIEPQFMRHASLPDEPITARLVNYEFVPEGVQSVTSKVLDYFKSNADKEIEPHELLDAKLGSNTAVYKSLRELQQAELIERLDWGKYKLKGGEDLTKP